MTPKDQFQQRIIAAFAELLDEWFATLPADAAQKRACDAAELLRHHPIYNELARLITNKRGAA